MRDRLFPGQKTELIRLSWPLLVETLLVMLIGNVSTILLAAFSDDAAGSISVANQVVSVFHLTFMIISTGTGILAAQYVGAKLNEKTAKLGGMAIFIAFLLGLAGTVILLVFAETFLTWLNLEGTFLAYGKTFAMISAGGFAIQAVSFVMSQIIFSHGYTKVGMTASLFRPALTRTTSGPISTTRPVRMAPGLILWEARLSSNSCAKLSVMSSVITASRATRPVAPPASRPRRVDETAPASCRATVEKKTPHRSRGEVSSSQSDQIAGNAPRARTRMRFTTSSTVMPVESMTTASVAGRRGATERAESRLSRSRISCERPARLAASPFSFNWL